MSNVPSRGWLRARSAVVFVFPFFPFSSHPRKEGSFIPGDGFLGRRHERVWSLPLEGLHNRAVVLPVFSFGPFLDRMRRGGVPRPGASFRSRTKRSDPSAPGLCRDWPSRAVSPSREIRSRGS